MEKIYTEGERLDLVINALEGGNQKRFAEKTGIIPSTLSRIRSGQLSMKMQIDKIVIAYPQVSREWLVSGVGYPGDISVDIVRGYYEKVIQDRNETIHILTKEIELQQAFFEKILQKERKKSLKQ